MPSAKNLTPEARFQAIFVGRSGTGKTPAACSFPGPVLDLYFDNRIRGLLGCPWINRDNIEYNVYPISFSKTAPTVYSRLNADLEIIQMQANSGQLRYKTIVADSLTSQTWAFLKDAISLTHVPSGKGEKGHSIGPLKMAGPQDYGFESTGTKDFISFLKSIPGVNIILTAHLIDEYGPADPDDSLKGNIIVGKKLSLRDKLAAEIPGGFDHIFEFDRVMEGDRPKFKVRFWSEIARTTFQGMPYGWQDITNKNFYEYLQEMIAKGQTK
jgi:hypothetical protein